MCVFVFHHQWRQLCGRVSAARRLRRPAAGGSCLWPISDCLTACAIDSGIIPHGTTGWYHLYCHWFHDTDRAVYTDENSKLSHGYSHQYNYLTVVHTTSSPTTCSYNIDTEEMPTAPSCPGDIKRIDCARQEGDIGHYDTRTSMQTVGQQDGSTHYHGERAGGDTIRNKLSECLRAGVLSTTISQTGFVVQGIAQGAYACGGQHPDSGFAATASCPPLLPKIKLKAGGASLLLPMSQREADRIKSALVNAGQSRGLNAEGSTERRLPWAARPEEDFRVVNGGAWRAQVVAPILKKVMGACVCLCVCICGYECMCVFIHHHVLITDSTLTAQRSPLVSFFKHLSCDILMVVRLFEIFGGSFSTRLCPMTRALLCSS